VKSGPNKIAASLTTMLEGKPGDWIRHNSAKAEMVRVVWSGVFFELAHDVGSKEIAHFAGVKSHTTILSNIEKWFQLSWEVRYSWLVFARGYIRDGWCDPVRDELGRLCTAMEEMESGSGHWASKAFRDALPKDGRPKITVAAIKKLKRSISDEEDH